MSMEDARHTDSPTTVAPAPEDRGALARETPVPLPLVEDDDPEAVGGNLFEIGPEPLDTRATGYPSELPPELPSARPPGHAMDQEPGNGVRKAAVFILSLEEDVASVLLRSLSDRELGLITAEIANLGVVDKETVSGVMREFRELEHLHRVVREGGFECAVRLVERSFPHDKATRIKQLLSSHSQHLPFSFLESMEIETLVACLEEEHPQTLALVFAHLSPSKAAEVLEKFPAALRRDILERIAGLEGANAGALEKLESTLKKHLDAARFESVGDAGGVKRVAQILRAAGGDGGAFLNDLRQGRPQLADEIDKQLFVFEDIVQLDTKALQAVLKEVDTHRLALALKTSADELKDKIFSNLPRRSAEALRDEIELMGPVRFAHVEAARSDILETVFRLEESGQLYISGRGREENRIVY
jgi:flagellar motor switch protein FliG